MEFLFYQKGLERIHTNGLVKITEDKCISTSRDIDNGVPISISPASNTHQR